METQANSPQETDSRTDAGSGDDVPLSARLSHNVTALNERFAKCSDWVLREFRIAGGRPAALAYIDGIVNRTDVENIGLRSIMYDAFPVAGPVDMTVVHRVLEQHVVPFSQVEQVTTLAEVIDHVLHGDAIFLVDGEGTALAVNLRDFRQRAVAEPEIESVVRGPREGFVENIRTNTALVRQRIRSPDLKMEALRVGRRTRTDVVVAYVKGLAGDDLVEEVKSRIGRIDIDGIIDSGYVEELIQDDPYSPFPQTMVTERPDIVAASLLEGRVAIFVSGSPGVIVVPVTLWSLLEASEDWYSPALIGNFLRALRIVLAFIALLGPAVYVAVLTYHQEMLPTNLLMTVVATREGIPFPALIEAFIMEVLFEALREAGVRLPKVVGQAVSIVGALVIGQSAVQAGIVSAPTVIVVATTGIASFAFPRFNLAIAVRLLRFPLIVLGGTLGLYGIIIGLLFILVHLSALRSFGIPYLKPLAPFHWADIRRAVFRSPMWARDHRPWMLSSDDHRRQVPGLKPGPREDDSEEPVSPENASPGKGEKS